MKKFIIRASAAALGATLLVLAVPALAAVPTVGLVIEGVSVPGVAIGDSRTAVESSYGAPSFCQSISAGDFAYCTYQLEGENSVSVRYVGPNGGTATASGSDVVSVMQWNGLEGWETTVGINTSLALSNPEAVIAAYSNATITYNGDVVQSVIDSSLGIKVEWLVTYPIPTTVVFMSIFQATTQPPAQEVLRSVNITLQVVRSQIVAKVTIEDGHGNRIGGAVVSAKWTLPTGEKISVTDETDANGIAKFATRKSKGTFRIEVVNVKKTGYVFDSQNSILSAEI